MKVCEFFKKGNCRFGKNCKFSHETAPQRPQMIPEESSGVVKTSNPFAVAENPMDTLCDEYKKGAYALTCCGSLLGDISPEEFRFYSSGDSLENAVKMREKILGPLPQYRSVPVGQVRPNQHYPPFVSTDVIRVLPDDWTS